jgi:TPR repeat protein
MADVSFDEKRFADARAEFLALKGLFDFCLQETEKSKQTEESAKQRNRTALGKLVDDPSLFPIVRRDLTDAQIGLLSGAYGKVDDAKKKLKELLMCYTGNHPEVKAVYISLKMSMEQFKDLVRKLLEDPAVDSPLIDTTGNTLKAIEAFDAKRYDEAYGLFMKSDLGNKEVQWHLGRMYEYGHGVAKNASEAVKWYRKAAEQGHSGAQNNLGIMYKGGRGVTKDDYEAVKWFRKSAEQGNSTGQCNIGQMYLDGRGVMQNDYEAVKWFRKAFEHGNAIGQNRLAFMYASGRGVARNEAEAVRLYRLSADKFPPSLYALASMYENGSGVSRDVEEAKKWYRKAAEKGDENAKKALERLEKENVRVIQPVQSIGPVSLPPQHQTLIDRPYDLQFCRHCRMRLSHLKKISRSCPQCGENLFGR